MATKKNNLTKSAAEVVKQFRASWDYAEQNHHARWTRNLNLYNNKRAIVSYEGITNTFVPMVFSTVETLTSALGAGRPSIDFVPSDMYGYIMSYYSTGQKPNLKALNAQFDYYWDCDNWDVKSIKTIRNGFIYGISGEWIFWDGDKPRIINLGARDLIIDPKLSDPLDLVIPERAKNTYAGRRYHTTKAALKSEQIIDPLTGELKPRFKNLDRLSSGGSQAERTEKELKEMKIGSVADSDETIEVLEIWTGETIRSVANREACIEERDNVLGIIPLALNRFIADESIIFGKSIIDPIAHPQELLNDISNQSVDAVTDILNPQYELDPAYADHIPNLVNAPGVVHPFRPGSLQQVQKNTVNAAAFNERQNIKNEIREATGADQVVKGVTADQQTTATEIKAQLNQAGQRFELYIAMLEREGFYMRAKIVYKMMRKYLTEKQLVPTQGVDGPKFHVFDPEQFDDTYEPKIRLEASVKNSKAKDAAQATEAYQILIADPTNDLWEAKKVLYPKMFDLSEEELDRIIGSQKPQQAAMGGADPMADPMAAADPMGAVAPEVAM